MAVVIIDCEGLDPARVELPPGQYPFGTASDNAIAVDHPSVSRHHGTLIVHHNGRVTVQDMGSTNGILLDGQLISEATVPNGRFFQAGAARITVEHAPIPVPRRLSASQIQEPTGLPLTQSPLIQPEQQQPTPKTFIQEIRRAFLYPFKDEAYLYIVIVVGLGILDLFLPNFLGLASLLIGLITGCYLVIIWEQIVLSTVEGKDRFPQFPHLSFTWQEYLSHYLRYVALVWVCFAPAFLYRVWMPMMESPHPWLLPVLYGIGCLYFPMALLAFIINDSFAVLSPPFIIQSIGRVFKDYLLLVVMAVLMIIGESLIFRIIEPAMHADVAAGRRMLFQALSLFSGAISLYLIFVWLRLLGLLYRHHQDRLAWSV